jgi:hypothetical protein
MATQVTKNFTLEELCHSNTAKAKGISNIPGEIEKANLRILAEKILLPRKQLKLRMIPVRYRMKNGCGSE